MDKNTIGEKILAASVYVVSPIEGYCPGFILENYDFVEAGVLFRIVERVE